MPKRAIIIHGPNLNLLGKRERSVYGALDYESLNKKIEEKAGELGVNIVIEQSNHEGELVDIIQNAPSVADFVIINPGAYTHTSVAIRDALLAVALPVYEVHISNIFKREEFRRRSYISDIAEGVITGFGPDGYLMALTAACGG